MIPAAAEVKYAASVVAGFYRNEIDLNSSTEKNIKKNRN